MIIRNAEIEVMTGALKALDGVRDGEKLKPYKFTSGKTIFNIAKNLRLLDTAFQDLKSAHDKIVTGFHPAPDGKLEVKEAADYTARRKELMDLEIDLPLLEIAISEDEARDNQIPGSVIAGLGELLKI